ncbi:MAG: hypothetical protein ABEN55_03115, partial [Bradymonadaceae bacterium]
MANSLDGTCLICGETAADSEMTSHLARCIGAAESRGGRETDRGLLIEAEAALTPHWLHALAPASATFANLDAFLRESWLECCGHLSEFTVGPTRYAVDGDDFTGFGPPRES